ncbi:MAG: hypothetical protein U9R72_13725 [Chloroflexota bacterium]|nr:hypothetical protein [Chloroflexota bacterium]
MRACRRLVRSGGVVVAVAVMLGLAVGLTRAQSPDGEVTAQAAVGTAFTYQGQLTDDGSPANGEYDFEFTLYDAATGTGLVGSPVTLGDKAVTDGLFTVRLDFGSGAFNGDARWLGIGVKRSGESDYEDLDRQELTAAPYALHALEAPWSGLTGVPADLADGDDTGNDWSLTGNGGTAPGTDFLGTTDDQALELRVNGERALRLEPHTTSPNVIGGYSGNSVDAGVYGGTIGGGGESGGANSVTGDHGTVGGGHQNRAADASATVGGGYANTAGGASATVSGGVYNETSDHDATIGGGWGNEASGIAATVSGGSSNTAGGVSAAVGGGSNNTASGASATVGGGVENIASGIGAFVGGGGYDGTLMQGNEASGNASSIGGGRGNTASGDSATVGGGVLNAAGGGSATIGGGAANFVSGSSATVGGGVANQATDSVATVGGGAGNAASAPAATVPGGEGALADHYGEMAYASGSFADRGDAEASLYVMRSQDTMPAGTWYDLYLDGSSALLTVASGRTMTFEILVAGRSDASESAGYRIRGVIENDGGTMHHHSIVTTLFEDDANWTARTVPDAANEALLVQVGGNGQTIRWVASVRTAEVAW